MSWDWRAEARELIEGLIRDGRAFLGAQPPSAKARELVHPGTRTNDDVGSSPAGITFRDVDLIMVASGIDDLLENYRGLLLFLDRLDPPDRDGAYRALYFVLRGAREAVCHTHIPIMATFIHDAAQAAAARGARGKKLEPARRALREAIESAIASGRSSPTSRQPSTSCSSRTPRSASG